MKMVLSNKKLKQKLRAAALEASIGAEGNDQLKTDTNSQLKEHLDTAKRNPRLSKREKRRKDVSLKGLDSIRQRSNGVVSEESKNNRKDEDKENGVVGLIHGEENSKKKKRKRDELRGNGDMGSEEKEGAASMETSKKKNKKKKKKKKRKEQGNKGKEEGEKLDGAEEGTIEANNSNGR